MRRVSPSILIILALFLTACDLNKPQVEQNPDPRGNTLRIDSLSTHVPLAGGELAIHGAGFTNHELNVVMIGNRPISRAYINSTTEQEINLVIPAGTSSGKVSIRNGDSQTAEYATPVTVVSEITADQMFAAEDPDTFSITVQARSTEGKPVPGVRISLSSTSGEGTFAPSSTAVTNSDGIATATLDLSSAVEPAEVEVIATAGPLSVVIPYGAGMALPHEATIHLTDGATVFPVRLTRSTSTPGQSIISTYNYNPDNTLSSLSVAGTEPPRQYQAPQPTEIIVAYEPGYSPSGTSDYSALSAAGLQSVHASGSLELARVADGLEFSEALEALNADPRVAYAEPNYYYTLSAADPHEVVVSPRQWGLFASGAPAAWTSSTGESVVVAVIDTGVDTNHVDLAAVLLPGFDFCADNSTCDVFDDDPHEQGDGARHGTHVASTIAGQHNAELDLLSMAYNARILPVKVFPAGDGLASTFNIALAVRWAAGLPTDVMVPELNLPVNPHPADVINLSLGGDQYSHTLASAIDDAVAAGVTVVAASGNDYAPSINFPARLPNVIGVGAIGKDFTRADFSNYGPGLDLVAPGRSILGAYPNGDPAGIHGFMQGTSMSTPHVAGAAALLLSSNPTLTPGDIKTILTSTAYRRDAMTTGEYGAGALRVDAALGLPAPTNNANRYANIRINNERATLDLLNGTSTAIQTPEIYREEGLTITVEYEGRKFAGTYLAP